MNRKEYLFEQASKALKNQDKEELLSALSFLLERLSAEELEEFLVSSSLPFVPYSLAQKDALIAALFDMDAIEVYGEINHTGRYSYYDEEFDYDASLSQKDKEFFHNIVKLVLALEEEGEETSAFPIVEKLYSLSFVITWHDEYDNEVDEDDYDIDHFFHDFATKEEQERIKRIRLDGLIRERKASEVLLLLKKELGDKAILSQIAEKDPFFLIDLAKEMIRSGDYSFRYGGEVTYLFDLADDYEIYRTAVEKGFSSCPKLLTSFVKKYYRKGDNRKDVEILSLAKRSLLPLDGNKVPYYLQEAYYPLLDVFEDEEFVKKYYAIYKDDISFLILNSLDDDPFFEVVRERDASWLHPDSSFFDSGYSSVRHLLQALFETNEKEGKTLAKGIANYRRRVVYDQRIILKALEEKAIAMGRDYKSKGYGRYRDEIASIMKDINGAIDLYESVRNAYPSRPRLQEVFRLARWKNE